MLIIIILLIVPIVVSQNCTTDAECNNNGFCNQNSSCICDDGWLTIPNNDNISCNYKQRKQYTAFILSIFCGILGTDQWYVGNYALAGPKLVFGIIFLLSVIVTYNYRKSLNHAFGYLLLLLSSMITFSWWLSDVLKFRLNKYTDGNDMPLLDMYI